MEIKNILKKILVDRRRKRIAKRYNAKINKLNVKVSYIDQGIVKQHLNKLAKIFEFKIETKWIHNYSSATNFPNANYIPESVYYSTIEPILNKYDFILAYADKNFYDLLGFNNIFPANVLRNIDGSMYDGSYNKVCLVNDNELYNFLDAYNEVIIKPSVDSGGGQYVERFTKSDINFINSKGDILSLQYLERNFKTNFVVQKTIYQHKFYSEFNVTSVNTVRVLVYRCVSTNNWIVLHTILRVGQKGEYVDNSRAGGYAIGVNEEGKLNSYATLKNGTIVTVVNDIDLSTEEKYLFMYDEIKNVALTIARKNLHSRLLGLDMVVDYTKSVKCIEVNNSGNEINFYQLNNGPLFGNFTDDVLNFCLFNKSALYDKFVF